MTLKSFPRGGKKPLNKKQLENQPFSKNVKSKKHRKNQDNREKETFNAETNLYDSTAERLSNATLREGLIVLGRIYEATEYDLLVSLPGGIVGRVQVTDISESYTNLLQSIVKTKDEENEAKSEFKSLPELYSPGDYVVCYVKSVQPDEKWQVALSLEPRLVNQNVDPRYLSKGSKTVCVISSIEDHGYVVDTGMVNARGFAPSQEVDADKTYFPGKQLLCSIIDIKKSENTSTIKLSVKKKHVLAVDTSTIESLDTLMPGTRLTLDIQKVLPNGLQVSFGENYIGYVNQLYLKHPLAAYTSGLDVVGTLLYISPTVKFGYFSLLPEKSKKESLDAGEIVGKATVLFREGNGIVLQLTKSGLRGFVPLKRTDVDYTKINEKFTSGSKHKCRVLSYNWIEGVYVCTMQQQLLEQKYFSISDFEPGELVKVRITRINAQLGFVNVQVGKLYGYIAPEHVSDSGLSALKKLKVNDEVEARVLGIDTQKNKVRFTLKKSLVKSTLPILNNIQLAKPREQYEGTVVQINKNGLLVKFYDEVKGWLPREVLGKEGADSNWNYSIGQTILVKIQSVEVSSGKMLLDLPTKDTGEKEEVEDSKIFIGDQVEGTVTDSSVQGVYLRISKDDGKKVITGFLPAGHISPCMEVAGLLASKYMPGDTMTALVFATTPSLILTRTFLPQEEYRNFSTLKIGDSIPCLIKDITQDGLRVILPVVGCTPFGFVPYNKVTNYNLLSVNQMLFAKIISINKKEKLLGLTMQLKKIYDDVSDPKTRMMAAVDVLSIHFHKLSELARNSFYKNRPISSAKLGQKVAGKIQKKTDDGLVIELENNLLGIVGKDHYSQNLKVGDKVTGKILWINYVHEVVDLTLLPSLMNSISDQQYGLSNLPVGTLFRSEIVMVTNWFVLIILKGQHGKGSLAALPARRHLNDLQPDLSPYVVRGKLRCYVIFNRDESDMIPICMLKSAFEMPGHSAQKKAKSKLDQNLKRKNADVENEETSNPPKRKKANLEVIDITDNSEAPKVSKKKRKKVAKAVSDRATDDEEKSEDEVEDKSESSEPLNNNKKKRRKKDTSNKVEEIVLEHDEADESNEVEVVEEEEEERIEEDTNDSVEIVEKPKVPECGFYWDDKPDMKLVDTVKSSSDSEEEIDEQPKQKKKKLNAAERREQERQKEREIRQREEALASNLLPNSVDQFDRLVLASPDSSLIWLQYMAYHLQATEIEKARAVARRAIKTISFREENEKLNVWNAWLNLESKFGTPESLNDVFQEAVKTNDALKVYMHMLTVHVDAGRQVELEKIVNTMIGKFKQNPEVWVDCGAALLKLGLKDKSRHIMQRGLQSLPASHHVNLMVRFANLENKFGDKARSQTLFEQILSSYPKRVDVWSSYVDSLVKSGDIEIARKVLDRAVVQTLPARKMKSLFKKYINFEEQHGTPENVSRVQQLAAEYVEKQISKEGVQTD